VVQLYAGLMHDALATVTLDRAPGSTPLPTQIAAALRTLVATGALASGDAVPSSRAAARTLSVSRGTVTAAYDQLVAEGYLVARDRSGYRVAPRLVATAPRTELGALGRAAPRRVHADFTAGAEPERPLDDAAWRSALRTAIAPGGPQLEDAVAQHLRLVRAMAVPASSVVVTAGARAGLALLLGVAARRSGRVSRVAVESPGFPGLRRVLEALAVDVIPVPVRDGRMDASALDAALPLDLVLVTPNHQFPSGTSLPVDARQALIAWATRSGALLVEDDYDSEYRHLGPPLPPLWSLAPDRVAHLGTFSAVLGRDIGTGYLLVPPSWADDLAAARKALGAGVAPLLQRALARYLQAGGLKRRLGRARRRSSAAAEAVAGHLDALRAAAGVTSVTDSGHLLVLEMGPIEAARVRHACAAAGLRVADLAEGWAGGPGRTGVLLNYGGRSPEEATSAVATLLSALAPR